MACHPEPFDLAQDKLREGSLAPAGRDSSPAAQNDIFGLGILTSWGFVKQMMDYGRFGEVW